MYDELVSELREKAEFLACAEPLNIKNAFAESMKQAADAIEELVATVGTAYNELANNEANKPRWVSVTERLPENCADVLAYIERMAWGDGDVPYRKREIAIGYHVNGLWHVDGCSHVDCIAWMPLPEPPKGEK